MVAYGSVNIYFDVEGRDCEGVERVLRELKALANAAPDAEYTDAPLAWARNGELHKSPVSWDRSDYRFAHYECHQLCAGAESSFGEFEGLMGEFAPTVSYSLHTNNYNTVVDRYVDEWHQSCTALASRRSPRRVLRTALPVGHGVIHITNWDRAGEGQREAARVVFRKHASAHAPAARGIDEWAWLAEEHDPSNPHLQTVHFGVPGTLDAVKLVYAEVARAAPELEITGDVAESVPLGPVGGAVAPLDFGDAGVSPDDVCGEDSSRCLLWSPSGVAGLAWSQDGDFGASEGFDGAVERFCAPLLAELPKVFGVKGKKLKPAEFMGMGTPLSLTVKHDARNGEFQDDPRYLPEEDAARQAFGRFARFHGLGSEGVPDDQYGKASSPFVGLVAPNGKSVGRLDADREEGRMLMLRADSLACFAVSNDPYAVLVDIDPAADPAADRPGYEFNKRVKREVSNAYGSLSDYEAAHPERSAAAAVRRAFGGEI